MRGRFLKPICILAAACWVTWRIVNWLASEAPADETWAANAVVQDQQLMTVEGLGAAQGIDFHDGKFYLYGDVYDAVPRVGIIREYTKDFQPTGRYVWLRRGGQPLLRHPTGLAFHPKWGVFLGDTIDEKGVIYHVDWEKAWSDRNLDHAILDVIEDDVAVNGCRPEFVTIGGRDYLATADYGDARPEIRLYDPEVMLKAKRTSAPGVIVYRVLCGPYNQNLYWDAAQKQLTCVQNVVSGRGWRLDVLDLPKAVADGRAWGPNVRAQVLTFSPRDELEGYCPMGDDRWLFVTSKRKDNLILGVVKAR
jgi:hypothetical protein